MIWKPGRRTPRLQAARSEQASTVHPAANNKTLDQQHTIKSLSSRLINTYPIHIHNHLMNAVGGHLTNVAFLIPDGLGVLG